MDEFVHVFNFPLLTNQEVKPYLGIYKDLADKDFLDGCSKT